MKELSIEEKAKLYDEAVERANSLINCNQLGDAWIYRLLPELQEDSDERIMKDIIAYIRYERKSTQEEIENRFIPWLEKQGEKKPTDKVEPKFKVGDKIIEKDLDECSCGTIVNIKDGKYIFDNGCFIHIKEQDLWQLVEKKPTDNVEPKIYIKNGQWYVCIQSFTLNGNIVVTKGQTYKSQEDNAISGEEVRLFIDKHDGDASKYFRPWTIKDAKNGDVLATDDGDICVFDGTIEEGKYPFANCGLTRYGFESYDGKLPFTHDDVHPATKEQCDLLFQKMKEAGYEWDAEKKGLRKIDPKPTWSEDDERMFNSIVENLDNGEWFDIYQVNWLKSLKDRMTWRPTNEQTKE